MREFVTNFQKKHGQQVPMPKIYGDEDSSDSEGLELADGTKVDKDIISYRQPQKKFGTNKRTLMEVIQGYKYRYPGGVSTKVPFVPTKPEEGEEAPTTSGTAPASDPTTT